jgi:hypothetical protein
MPYLADPQGYGKPLPEDEEPIIVEQGSSAPAVTDVPAPIPAPAPASLPTPDPGYLSTAPPPAPASESYGGDQSAIPPPSNPYADEGNYRYMLASNPDYVQTIKPGTGESPTYRYIPPAGSTYPADERNRDLPPITPAHEIYPEAFPDLEPYWTGEGGRDAPPPTPHHRYAPATTMNAMLYPYFAGEGAMGRADPLDPRNSGELDGARPLIQYRRGPGETSAFTRFRPGWGGREFLETVAAMGGPAAPPPGYVPELIHHQGRTVSTRDMERATPRTLSPTPMPPPPNEPPALPRGGGPQLGVPPGLMWLLAQMERRRRERTEQEFPLAGLFGAQNENLARLTSGGG